MNDQAPDGFDGCHCLGVSRDQVIRAITAGCTTVEAVRRQTGACSGCGSCRPEIQALLTALRSPRR